MKFILLAAAAVIATPVLAQQNTPSNPPQPQSAAPTPGDSPAPSDTTMAAPAPAAPMAPAGDPVGGYQPARPAMSGPMTPGATVNFVPAPSPDQAYPAPAPLAKYPVCKKGQYDKCIQRGGK